MWFLVQVALLVAKFTVLPALPWFVVLFPAGIIALYLILILAAVVIAAIAG